MVAPPSAEMSGLPLQAPVTLIIYVIRIGSLPMLLGLLLPHCPQMKSTLSLLTTFLPM
jgi:hypothetical protein